MCKINLDRVLWATESNKANRNLECAIIACAISEAARMRFLCPARDVMDAVADHLLEEMRTENSNAPCWRTKRRLTQETAHRMVEQMDFNLEAKTPP